MPERPIIVFDVNETLLNLDAIRPIFDRIFSDPAAMRLWFANLITYSEALTLAGVYVPFTDIGGAVLQMLAATRGITISDADRAELTARFAAMPPHPEVPAARAGSVSMASGSSRSPTTRWRSPGGSWSGRA
jgi:2-haloacid dehalogenase